MAQVQAGLKANPNNVQLQALQELMIKRVQNPVDSANLDQQIQSLAGSARTDQTTNGSGQTQAANTVNLGQVNPVGAVNTQALAAPQSTSRVINTAWEATALRKMELEDYSGAEVFLTQIIHDNPTNMQAYRIRAEARFDQKDYEGALEDVQGALNVSPRDVPMLNLIGRILTHLDRLQEALKAFQQSLDLNPKNARTYVYRAQTWRALGNQRAALQDLQDAAIYDPSLAKIYQDMLNSSGRGSNPLANHPWWLSLLAGILIMSGAWIFTRAMRPSTPIPLAMLAKRNGTPSTAQPISLAPGARFGDFEIVRPLGRGGMGVVYEAQDLLLGRPVAIKKMREEIAQDPREKERFIKEARIVASLDHHNIVRIHSVLERPDGLYLIFEYVPGDGLDRILDRQKRLSFADAMNFLRPMGHALDYAHRRGIVHRDLKPSNVMVSREGVVKVMDFGIARRVQETIARLTQNGNSPAADNAHMTVHKGRANASHSAMSAVGTPLYMAPEQAWGECVKESDTYALAICLYEMLTGQVPFNGPNPHQQKMDRMFTPISRVLRNAPKALDSIFDRALDPTHGKRFHSAAEFVKALEAVIPAATTTPRA